MRTFWQDKTLLQTVVGTPARRFNSVLGGHGRFRGACTTASGGEEYENPPMESSYAYFCVSIGLEHLFAHVVGMRNVWQIYENVLGLDIFCGMRKIWDICEKIMKILKAMPITRPLATITINGRGDLLWYVDRMRNVWEMYENNYKRWWARRLGGALASWK